MCISDKEDSAKNRHSKKRQPLRVLHVLSGDLWAGAEVMVRNLLQEIGEEKNIALRTILLNEGFAAEAIRQTGTEVCVLDEKRLPFQELLTGLHRQIIEFKPQIVHVHRYKENLLSLLATIGKKDKPVLISTQHGLPETYGKASLKSKIITKGNFLLLGRFFEKTVAVSCDIKNFLVADCRFNKERVAVIYNGVQPPVLSVQSSSKPFRIGTCGRLTPVKNYGLFIEMASIIAGVSSEIEFVLAGDGPDRARLKSLSSKLGLERRLSMPGHLDDMEEFYRSLNLYVSTSLHEGIPMSVLEAMGHGIPAIAPRVGGFSEIIADGIDGLLMPEFDPNAFASACLQLIGAPKELKQMGKAARNKIETQFSVQRMAKAYDELYQKSFLDKKRTKHRDSNI